MNTIGKTIKRLRVCKGDTQEQLAEQLHISAQAVSKWENDAAMPDILLLPLLSDYFGITIDELFEHKLNSYTYKENFIRLMFNSGVLSLTDKGYYINTEKFITNAQIAKIGECFADLIRENNLVFDAIMGLAYHGVAFSTATATALYQKYGLTTYYYCDRKVPDSKGRMICGYTPNDGDKIIVIDDVIGSGKSLDARLNQLLSATDVDIVAVISIVDYQTPCQEDFYGSKYIENKYDTKVITLISDEDIKIALEKQII